MRLRNKIVEILVWFLERDLSSISKETLAKGEYDLLMCSLWQNPAFRKYVADRDAKLIFTMAGSEGMKPEPRDGYVMHTGQRVEILLLAREAKAAWLRAEKAKADALAQEQDLKTS